MSSINHVYKNYVSIFILRNCFKNVEKNVLDITYLFLSTETVVGTHENAIRCVEYSPDVNVVITGSWDSTVKMWDPRTPCAAGCFNQPERVSLLALGYVLEEVYKMLESRILTSHGE